ncbi:MAG: O-antigen ligase family protein [Bacteroidales bacterium]|nr:O-antigen ligase family protein [Bacteroidales bacterium]
MLKRIKGFLVNRFSSLQSALKSIIFIFVSLMSFFLVLSDRTPYNSVAFAIYGVETVLIIFYILKYGKIHIDLFGVLLLGFLLIILVSQILNMSLLNYPRTLFLLCVFAFIFYQFLLTLNAEEKLLIFRFIFIGGCLMAAFFLIYYFPDSFKFKFEDRLGRDLSDQNDLAKHFALFTILSEYFSFKSRGKKKIPYIICGLVFVYILLLTGSISNLLVLSLLTIGLIVYMAKGRRKLFAIIGIVATIIVFIILLQLPFMAYFKTRIENMVNTITTGSGSVDYSFIDRFNLAIYGLRLFTSKPLFGYGYDQVQFYTWGKDAFSHNNFVELLASFGIIGFIIFEFLLLFPIYKCWKKEGKEITVFLLLYLFAFQLFLIIYRKKIEYFLIPLSFSFVEPKLNGISIAIKKGRIEISKNGADRKKEPESYYSINI